MDISIKHLSREALEGAFVSLSIKQKNADLFLHALLHAITPATAYHIDCKGKVLGCNSMQATLFGLNTPEDLIGKDIYYLGSLHGWTPAMCDAVRAHDLEVIETGKSMSFEEAVVLNGIKKTFLSYKTPQTGDNGEILGVFGFSVDITEHKQAEQTFKEAYEISEKTSTTEPAKRPVQALKPEVTTTKPVKQPIYRMLLVEDSLLPQKIAIELLERMGHHVTPVVTAKETLEQAMTTQFDVILMDIGLPDGDGIELTRMIRSNKLSPNVSTVIAMLTAHADSDIHQACLDAGAHIVFDKPLSDAKIKKLYTFFSDHVPLIDLKGMAARLGISEAMAKEFMDAFMYEHLNQSAQDISQAFEAKDWDALKMHVHRLQGALCYAGAPRLTVAVKKFNTCIKKNPEDSQDAFQALWKEINATTDAYCGSS